MSPPTYTFPAKPAPPNTFNAPVEVLVEAVVLLIVVAPISVVAPVTLSVPVTVSLPLTLKLANVVAPADNVEEKVPAAPLKLPVKLNEVPVAAPMIGVTRVGVFAKTNKPEPVSSVIALSKLALVGVAKKLAIPVPKPLTPVAIGNPVALVKVAEVGVPNIGVTKVGLVDNTKLPEPVELVTPVPPCATSIVVALHTPVVIVPTVVKLELTTLLASIVPVNVFEAAATVISALPSNETPLIFFVAANLVAVLALPVNAPVKLVADKDVKPVTLVTVPPKVIVVDPNVVVLVANWPTVIPAEELKLDVVNPVAEIVPELIEIPDPAVNPSWIPKPVIFALVIFNFEKSIAAPEATSVFAIVDLVANDPKPRFVLASVAFVAPVPPFAIATSVPLHTPLAIVPTVAKLANEVNVVFDVAVILPAVLAVVALPDKFPVTFPVTLPIKLGAVTSLLNVFAPAIVCAPVEIKPGLVPSAAANVNVVPLTVPPFA